MRTITAISSTPFTDDDLKAWLRITHEAEDDLIATIKDAAVQEWENVTGYVLRSVTFEDTVLGDPDGYLFPTGPSLSSVSVEHSGTTYTPTASSGTVRLITDGGRPRLYVKARDVWDHETVTTITWTAQPQSGASVGSVPALIKCAVFSYAGTLWENRSSVAPVQLHAVTHGWQAIAASHSWASI